MSLKSAFQRARSREKTHIKVSGLSYVSAGLVEEDAKVSLRERILVFDLVLGWRLLDVGVNYMTAV